MSAWSMLDVPIGHRVAGYEVTGLLAHGGWGSVYAGRGPGGAVALKFVPVSSALRADIVAREVRFGRAADHPCLIRGFGAHEQGDTVVLVMELAEASLAERMHPGDPGAVLADICRGLVHLHERNIVHGDLKPSNVLFVDGRAKLADFGLSTELDGTHGYGPHLGSVDYVPPEWWSEPLDEQGARLRFTHDMWAFGMIAYQLLGTGRRWPFPGQTARARALNAASVAPSLDALPPSWRGIVGDCLAADHKSRAAHSSASILARVQAARFPGISTPRRPAGATPPPAGRAHGITSHESPTTTSRGGRRLALATTAVLLVAGGALAADGLSADGPGLRAHRDLAGVAVPFTDPNLDRFSGDGLLVDAGVPSEYWGTVGRDEHVAVTDVTGDGRPEVLVVRTTADGAEVQTWTPRGPANPRVVRIAEPLRSLGVAAGDVTGDGHGDLVAYHRDRSGAAEVAVWPGGPDGPGAAKTVVFTGSLALADAKLAVGDVTGDGTADVVLARAEGTAMTLHLIVGGPRIAGSGNRVARVDRPLAASSIAAADVTGDGHADLLVRSRDAAGRGELHVVEGNRVGFAEQVLTPMRVSPEHALSMVVGTDVTGDGAPDAVLGKPIPGAGAVILRRLAGGGPTMGPDEMLIVVGLSRLVV